MKDNIFGNNNLPNSLSKIFEEQERIMKSFRTASDLLELSGIAKYNNLALSAPAHQIETAASAHQFETAGSAYIKGMHQSQNFLPQKFQDQFTPMEKVLGNINTLEKILGKGFQERILPSYYLPYNLPYKSGKFGAADNFVSAFSSAATGVNTASGINAVSGINTASGINTSWLQQVNPWLTKLSWFNSLDTAALTGVNTAFSKLIKLERETSVCASISNRYTEITSAAAQLASIGKSLSGIEKQWRNAIAPPKFLDGYNTFAARQHKLIQKAADKNDDKSVEWRLDLLDATSRFVDRQITWANEFVSDIQEDVDAENAPVSVSELDIAEIPRYIGYSKRDEKVVDEALAESSITVITEKGKLIVEKARLIHKFCKVGNREPLFEKTDLYVGHYVTLAGTFCGNEDSLEIVIDALYHLFYLQRDRIFALTGIDDVECMDQLKDLKDKKNYPERPKKISDLQNKLYDRFLKLEDLVIEKLESDTSSGQSVSSAAAVLAEDCWSEETVSKYIFKALFNMQRNKVFYGKKEDELNDYVRDALNMIYEVKDQTRQGTSPGGKEAGEVDMQICKDGLPIAMIEGLRVNSVERNYIKTHIDKVLTCYDPIGCPYSYVIIYATAKNFADFWEKCLNYIREEYSFPYAVKEEIRELNHIYTASRHAKTVLLRDDREVAVHFYAVSVQ